MSNDVATKNKPGPMMAALMGSGPLPVVDTATIQGRINERILAAKTPEELFNAGKAWKLEDLQSVPLEVKQVYLRPSSIKGSEGNVFAVIEATRLDTGEEIVVSTSANAVLTYLAKASDEGWLPFRFKARKADKPTADGYFPFNVEPV